MTKLLDLNLLQAKMGIQKVSYNSDLTGVAFWAGALCGIADAIQAERNDLLITSKFVLARLKEMRMDGGEMDKVLTAAIKSVEGEG